MQIDINDVYAATTRARAVRCLAVLSKYKIGQEEVKDMHRCHPLRWLSLIASAATVICYVIKLGL